MFGTLFQCIDQWSVENLAHDTIYFNLCVKTLNKSIEVRTAFY